MECLKQTHPFNTSIPDNKKECAFFFVHRENNLVFIKSLIQCLDSLSLATPFIPFFSNDKWMQQRLCCILERIFSALWCSHCMYLVKCSIKTIFVLRVAVFLCVAWTSEMWRKKSKCVVQATPTFSFLKVIESNFAYY